MYIYEIDIIGGEETYKRDTREGSGWKNGGLSFNLRKSWSFEEHRKKWWCKTRERIDREQNATKLKNDQPSQRDAK